MLLLAVFVACLQLNLLLMNHLMLTHSRRMGFLKALLHFSPPCLGFRRRLQKKKRPRRFWIRPGRTSAWWDNFESNSMLQEEWKEDFRMSWSSLVKLSEILRPYIEGKSTRMGKPVSVMRK